MTVTYHLDYEAFGVHVLNSDWMEADMLARAERGKAFAEAIAPFDPADTDGEHYRDHFHARARKHGGVHRDRAEGILSNSHPAAISIEFGTGELVTGEHRPQGGSSPEHATLRKALDGMA